MTLGQLNKKIAEKVFNLTVVKNEVPRLGYNFYTIGEPVYFDIQGSMELQNGLPDYSGDMNLAYEILNKLQGVYDIKSTSTGWWISMSVRQGNSDKIVSAQAVELPEAICLAALKAVLL